MMRVRWPAGEGERFVDGCLDASVGKLVRFDDDESDACPCYGRVVDYTVAEHGRLLLVDVVEVEVEP